MTTDHLAVLDSALDRFLDKVLVADRDGTVRVSELFKGWQTYVGMSSYPIERFKEGLVRYWARAKHSGGIAEDAENVTLLGVAPRYPNLSFLASVMFGASDEPPDWRKRVALIEPAAVTQGHLPVWEVCVGLKQSMGQRNPPIPEGLPLQATLLVAWVDRRNGTYTEHAFYLEAHEARAIGRALIQRAELIDQANAEERFTPAEDTDD